MSGNILIPSSSTQGFFQPRPRIQNQWTEDSALQRMARLFLTADTLRVKEGELEQFATAVLSPEVFANIVDAERHPPYVRGDGYTAFGAPQDSEALVTSAGWRYLQDFGLREGVVAGGYDKALGPEARVVQALKVHLFAPSSAMVVCPSGMQDGAIYVLMKELARSEQPTDMPVDMIPIRKQVMEVALSRLLDRDPKRAWTSGQWMTERMGGSDVRGTETVAKYVGASSEGEGGLGTDVNGLPLGPWSITGFKFFSSATDCGCSLVLAYTPNGLSCFFAPTRRLLSDGSVVMNGLRIQRLKNKLGTHALPTAELEIKDMRAWLVGEEGQGVKVISTVLNNSRFHNAARAIGYFGRGLSVARAYARVRAFPSRKAPNNLLRHIPLFLRTIANNTLQYRADVLLVGWLSALFGTENTLKVATPLVPSDIQDVRHIVRFLTSLTKAYTTKHGIAGLQECMEALGGIGYLENDETPEINVARMYRDANVFAIWEGTTDILSTDTVKVVRGRDGPQVLAAVDRWLKAHLAGAGGPLAAEAKVVADAWTAFQALPATRDDLMPQARGVVKHLGDILAATLLIVDARRDGNQVAAECVRRFVAQNLAQFSSYPERKQTWQQIADWDNRIAFEADPQGTGQAKL